MLTIIAATLIFIWILGYARFPASGNFIHILLMLAIIVVLIRVIRGSNPFK